ncbi:hypothetical protein L3X37_04985 [Sabulilitoribacter arenilitoris]|uniref:Uncharacterized protein n=1 Tax=Wocania arenilitoris TaxID=2044858 RepID=A0AAE3EPF3_9FLAO|nr:hypothetical protein [Wocania arenilitoris]MCF7567719.1 hypothetical protein [Wocania arenilitoris]
MKLSKNALRISLFGMAILFFISNTFSQTKQLKRLKSKVGISSVDNFVTQSFDLYYKVYKYDDYAADCKTLYDDAIDILIQAEATIQINEATKI